MDNDEVKKYISLFLIFAFGLPIICVFLVKNVSIFQEGALSFILYGIEAMTPTLAALIVTAIFDGSAGLGVFLKKCYFKNIRMRYMVLALVLPLSVLVITKITSLIFVNDTPFITGVTARKLIIIIWALFAEEAGWRGFLQGKLDKRFRYINTSILVGCIWALWHYHFFWLGNMSAPLILFLLGCISDSFGYYWVTKKSNGNIIPASIWHFTGNLFFNLLLINPEYNHGSIAPYFIFVVCSAMMAVGVSLWGSFSIKKGRSINL